MTHKKVPEEGVLMANSTNTRHLPPWRPEPRICVNCRSELQVDRTRCYPVELKRFNRDGVAVVSLGVECRFCQEPA